DNSAHWAGCWSPLLIDMDQGSDPYPGSLYPLVTTVTNNFTDDDDADCWTPPFHNGFGIPIKPERPIAGGSECQWAPNDQAGVYIECDGDAIGCTPIGELGILPNLVSRGSVNARLDEEGFNAGFPPGTKLSKPD